MSYPSEEEWRCPHCGKQDIAVFANQDWVTLFEFIEGIPCFPEATQVRSHTPAEIFSIICNHCGLSSDKDDYWHMSKQEWEKEVRESEKEEADQLKLNL